MNATVKISNRAGASFPVRRMSFNFDDVPEYWVNGSVGVTHFMTALSALFPAGEKFFIDSVRAVRYHPAVAENQELQKEISAFIGQEAMHTHEHIGFNAAAQRFGHDVDYLDAFTDKTIQAGRTYFSKLMKPFGVTQEMFDLMATTALEHFTATIASQLLENTHMQALMTDETMARMWYWHAIEENEHKAVAYDVFEAVFGQGPKAYLARCGSLTIAMSTLFVVQSYFVLRLLQQDQQLNLKSLKEVYDFAYRPSTGIISGMRREMALYFKPKFHPNQLDTNALLNTWRAKLGL